MLETTATKKNNLSALIHAIRKTMAIGASGLILISPTVRAEAYINPHEIPLNLWKKEKICLVDFDQDGDLDIINYYSKTLTQQENIGSVTAPLFAPEKVLANRPHAFKIAALNNQTISCSHDFMNDPEVDIDNDGDLDQFSFATNKKGETAVDGVFLFENIGSKYPVIKGDPVNLPKGKGVFIDIDDDGDFDYFSGRHYESLYLNTGSPEEYIFVKDSMLVDAYCYPREERSWFSSGSSIEKTSYFRLGAIADINSDGLLDVVCDGNIVRLGMADGFGSKVKTNFFQPPSSPDILFGYKVDTLDFNQEGIDTLNIVYSDDTKSFQHISQGERIVALASKESLDKNSVMFKSCGLDDHAISTMNLVDFDGDKDLDLFAAVVEDITVKALIYCENKGSSEFPSFLSPITIDLLGGWQGLDYVTNITVGDRDGDGDNDILVSFLDYMAYETGYPFYPYGDGPVFAVRFYDNVGSSINPKFQYIGHTTYTNGEYWLDLNNDGKIESSLLTSRVDKVLTPLNDLTLLNKGKEEVISVAAAVLQTRWFNYQLIIAVNRPSQTQLYQCDLWGICQAPIILPMKAKEISLATGNFVHQGFFSTEDGDAQIYDEIALAIVDENGYVHLNIYGMSEKAGDSRNLKLMSHGKGGRGHSIAISAGQLDADLEDEIALSFVQEEGNVLAAAISFDMSVIGSAQLGKGQKPSIAVGNFSDVSGAYALSYITPNHQLKTATFQGDGSLISQGEAAITATEAKISKATFVSGSATDEYVVSIRQPNGTAGLVGFSSDGKVLGQLIGGVAQQPTVISQYYLYGEPPHLSASPASDFFMLSKQSRGLAVSVIQADKKPAVIFLDNQGNYLAKGVGVNNAVAATLVNGVYGSTVLVYIDDNGMLLWNVF